MKEEYSHLAVDFWCMEKLLFSMALPLGELCFIQSAFWRNLRIWDISMTRFRVSCTTLGCNSFLLMVMFTCRHE